MIANIQAPNLQVCISTTFSVSLELLQRFARALACIAFLRIMALLSINMEAIWRASFFQSREQADQCNNSGETEEVLSFALQFMSYQDYLPSYEVPYRCIM